MMVLQCTLSQTRREAVFRTFFEYICKCVRDYYYADPFVKINEKKSFSALQSTKNSHSC